MATHERFFFTSPPRHTTRTRLVSTADTRKVPRLARCTLLRRRRPLCFRVLLKTQAYLPGWCLVALQTAVHWHRSFEGASTSRPFFAGLSYCIRREGRFVQGQASPAGILPAFDCHYYVSFSFLEVPCLLNQGSDFLTGITKCRVGIL